jgi:hypothetical protein
MCHQQLLLLTNSKNTTPASFDDPAQFVVNLPSTIQLPRHCEIALGACSVDEAVAGNVGRLIYVALDNLTYGAITANAREGSFTKIIGAFSSEVSTLMPLRFCSLNNSDPLPLTSLSVRLVNQDGETLSGLQNLTEIVLYYREHKC